MGNLGINESGGGTRRLIGWKIGFYRGEGFDRVVAQARMRNRKQARVTKTAVHAAGGLLKT